MAQFWFSDPWSADPRGSFDQLRRSMEDLFDSWGTRGVRRAGVYPPVNLYETADGWVLTADLPGLRSDEIAVSIEGDRITLRGERRLEPPQDASPHRLERPSGSFQRTLQLPSEVDASKIEAVHRHGVLMLRIPKSAAQQPRRIAVQGG
jgi:HSP20 family protein